MSFEAPQALLLAIPLALLVLTLGRIAPPASFLRWALVPILTLALARPVLDRGGDAMDVVVVRPTFASLDALEGISAVILEDVPAQELGEPAMRVLKTEPGPMNAHQRPLPEHAEEFLASIDVAKKTESTYRYALHVFAEFVLGATGANGGEAAAKASEDAPAALGPIAPVSALQEDSLVKFRHWMRQDRGYDRRTESTYLAGAVRLPETANGAAPERMTRGCPREWALARPWRTPPRACARASRAANRRIFFRDQDVAGAARSLKIVKQYEAYGEPSPVAEPAPGALALARENLERALAVIPYVKTRGLALRHGKIAHTSSETSMRAALALGIGWCLLGCGAGVAESGDAPPDLEAESDVGALDSSIANVDVGDCNASSCVELFMAADGDDGNDASAGSPVKSLQKIQQIIHDRNYFGRPSPVNVRVRIAPGTYRGQHVAWPARMPYTSSLRTLSFLPLGYSPGGPPYTGPLPVFDGPVVDGKGSYVDLPSDGQPGYYSVCDGQRPPEMPGKDQGPCAFFVVRGGHAENTNVRWYYLKVQHYIERAIEIVGDGPKNENWSAGNLIYGCYFTKIGNQWLKNWGRWSNHPDGGYGAVLVGHSRNNRIENNTFYDLLNVSGEYGKLHGVYLAGHANNNTITGNRFGVTTGDPMRARNMSNSNAFVGNDVTNSGQQGFFSEWYRAASECPSWSNKVASNHLRCGYDPQDLQTFWFMNGGSVPSGCPRGTQRAYGNNWVSCP